MLMLLKTYYQQSMLHIMTTEQSSRQQKGKRNHHQLSSLLYKSLSFTVTSWNPLNRTSLPRMDNYIASVILWFVLIVEAQVLPITARWSSQRSQFYDFKVSHFFPILFQNLFKEIAFYFIFHTVIEHAFLTRYNALIVIEQAYLIML